MLELITPDDTTYVMQSYCTAVDSTLSEEQLPGLGKHLALPDGWRFRSRVLDSRLIVDTKDRDAVVIQDEFQNTYSRLP